MIQLYDAKSTITETKEKIDKAIEEKTSKFTDSKPDNVNINKTDDLSSQDSQPKVTFDGAGSVSLNLGSRNTQSALTNLNASNLSAVNVEAVDKNFTGAWSGAGALNFRGADSGKTSVAMTGAVAVNNVDSTVEANITANKNLTGAINNTVSTTLTDIAGGVGVAVAQGSESSYGFQGVFTYNKVINNAHADIKNADITAGSLVNSSSDNKNAAKAYDQTLTGAGLDVSGDSYSEFAKVGDTDSTQKSIESQLTGGEGVEADESVGYENSDYGNKIITAALAVAGAGDGAAQASLAISDVDNDFKSEVTNSKLNITNKTNINAMSNTLDINAAAGAAISSKGFGAGGSISWQTNDNEVTAGFDGGSDKKFLTTTGLDVTTENHALEINVGGQVSGGKGTAAGLAMAYNALNDNTKTYLKNAELIGNFDVNINANSSGKVYAVGAGVAVSGNSSALNGSVAINNLNTNTQNDLDNSTINAAKGVLINAKGDEAIANYAGTISASGSGAAVGLSVSVNNINSNVQNVVNNSAFDKTTGGSFTVDDSIDNNALLNAVVEKETFLPNDTLATHRVNNTYTGVIIDANATHDIKSALFNIGVAGTGAAVNGTVNINRINGATSSEVKNTGFNITSNINILANDFSNAAGLVGTASAAGTGAGVGVGSDSAVISRQVNASLDMNGKVDNKAKDVNIKSVSQQGVGSLIAGVAFAGVGVGASNGVGVSLVDGTTNASISNTKGKFDNLNTLGVSFGAGITGASVGLSVDILKTKDKTTTAVNNSDITLTKNANINATNNANVNYQMYDVGAAAIGAGLAGAIGVANVENNVTTDLTNSTIQTSSGKMNIAAQNNLDFENKAAVGGLAGLGGGVGVGVSVNTIDSSVNANVNGGNLKASEIDLKSTENRNVNQGVGVAAGGLGAATANVMITNVGKELDSSYESATNKDRKDKDGSQVDVNENLQKANDASINKLVDGDNLKSGGMNIELVSNADKQVTEGGAENSGPHINISGALNADKISVNNVGTNNLSQGLFTGSAGGISVNGAVGILNLNRNATTDITGDLTAKNLTINNQDDGNSEQEILQGGFGLLAAANVSHGALNVTGKNNITIAGGTLDTTNLNISNSDASKINVNSKGVTVSAGRAIGVLIAEGSLEGKNEIEINNATLKGDTISIKATAAPEVNVDALALSAGAAFAGSGLFAGSINDSSASIIGNGATFTSNDLNINAENISTVKTSTNSANGSLLASGSLTGILNNSNAAAAVDFQNATVNAPNTSVNVNSSPSQKVGLVSLGAGGLLAATGSIASVISNPSATANMSAKEITADDLKLTATAYSTPNISVKGLTVGAIASGSNLIQSVRNVNVDAKLKADSATLNSLDINAKTNSAPNLNVNGDGGGLVGVAPLAAVLNDTLKQSGAVNLDGTFNIKNSVKVNVQTSDAGTYKADALGAAVIGASGVELKRSSDSKAAINFNNADIKTAGSQNYTAINELGYSLDLEAAGAVETVISNSEINTTFDNQININSSTLATEGDESAIKLTSGDLTEQKYHTIANIQGGALGIGLANTDNTLNRSNAVKLNNSAIDAANNVYLNSGESKLTMMTFADVYNKTALPLSTAPTLKDNLKINNTVDINSGSTISAARNVNIKAQSGTEVITESAKEYNIYSGEGGTGNVIVTTGREGNAYETANNFVNIDGTIINNTRGLQNAGEDPMLKYTFGSQKFSDWLQEAIVTKKTSWFDGYKNDSDVETLTFKNYEHYLNFVYNMALKYDTSDLATHRQYLSDAAGTSSWYKGNFNADWTRWKNLMLAKYDTASTTPTGAIVSGGAVSVIAKTLNINGLIQSGFNNYVATINAQAITNLQRNGNKNLDNDAVIGDNRFKVNTTDAETVYNSQTGVYDKVVGLYYNPKITANTPIKNLDISGNKNVNIVGLDDVSGKISAKNLEVTTPGNIDLTRQISDTLTAQGDKSIKVTQTSGDIKIGKVASKGNVTLTASNGAIVNSVDTAVNMTGAADKIAAWQAAGLISDKDSDNSATNSAQAEKNIRLAGLENLFKRWALKDDGTVDETLYRQFINNTADQTKLTDEQINQLELYQTLQTSTDYGFSKNQLLYAVQENLLNPSAGITASISDPIITGKNITLTAKSLGKELEPVTYSDLSNIKTLEKLAGVKGGDVTINDNGSITVKAQSPITIAQIAAQDKLNITTQGNTFISGTTETKFNVNTPINAGNKKVVLMTGNGIDAMSGISAKDIELYAGAGDLNAKIIFMADKNSSIRAKNVNLIATKNIGTRSFPLIVFADNIESKAKHVYIAEHDAAGSPESADGNTNSNISYYSPAQSSTETTPTNEAAPVTNTYEPLNTPSVINSAEPANATPANNFTTRTISQLDKFSHSLNHNEPLSTESVDDDISADNFAAKITNQFDFDDILPPVNTVSEDDLTANKMLITLPDENLYILNVEGLDNETEPPLSLTQNKEHYVLALALSKSATLNKKSGSIYETLAKSWLDGMGYSEEAKQQIIKLSRIIARDMSESPQKNHRAFSYSARSFAE